ncbi:MAG: ribosome-associated translation inhibitor RaiA [Patescibacteria group bacterium]
MNIKIKGSRVILSDTVKDYVEKKMNMVEKYLGDLKVTNCDVELENIPSDQKNGDVYRVEVNLFVVGKVLRVEKSETTINKAVDKVKDHLVLMIKKHKEKKQAKERRQ